MTDIQQPFDFNMSTLKGITNELEYDVLLLDDNNLDGLQFENTLETINDAFVEALKECNGNESLDDQDDTNYSILENKLFDSAYENITSDMEETDKSIDPIVIPPIYQCPQAAVQYSDYKLSQHQKHNFHSEMVYENITSDMEETDKSIDPIVIPPIYQCPQAAVQYSDYKLSQHQKHNFHSEMVQPCFSQAIGERSQYGGLYAMAYGKLQEQRIKQLSNLHLTQSSLSKMYPQRIPQSSNLLYSHDVPGSLGNNNLYSIQNNCLVPVSLRNVLQQQTQVSDNHRPIQPASPTPTTPIEYKPKIKPKRKVALLSALEYRDLSMMTDEEAVVDIKYTNMRGRSQVPFPVSLHLILERSERDGYSSIISWMPHGRAFKIHNDAFFLDKVMPRFFFQTKMTSFTRQLGMYGFRRLIGSKNVDKGAFFHELFLRERSGLAKGINRQSTRRLLDKKNEPNLYLFKSMPFSTTTYSRMINNCSSSNEVEKNSTTTTSRKGTRPRVVRYSKTNSSNGNPVIPNVPPMEPSFEDFENSTPEAIEYNQKSFPISQRTVTDGALISRRTQKRELDKSQHTNLLEKDKSVHKFQDIEIAENQLSNLSTTFIEISNSHSQTRTTE